MTPKEFTYWQDQAVLRRAQKSCADAGLSPADRRKIEEGKEAITAALDKVMPLPSDPMTKHKLLDMAKQATADRGLNYGRPEDNFNRIARRWRTHIANRFGVHIALDGVSVAIMMADMKAARLENEPNHPDSWVDFAGYAACGAEIACK